MSHTPARIGPHSSRRNQRKNPAGKQTVPGHSQGSHELDRPERDIQEQSILRMRARTDGKKHFLSMSKGPRNHGKATSTHPQEWRTADHQEPGTTVPHSGRPQPSAQRVRRDKGHPPERASLRARTDRKEHPGQCPKPTAPRKTLPTSPKEEEDRRLLGPKRDHPAPAETHNRQPQELGETRATRRSGLVYI